MVGKTAAVLALAGAAQAFVYSVVVGLNEVDGRQGNGFDPTRIVPTVGDTIRFTWALPDYITQLTPATHAVIQSSFENPCTPLSGGFSSGEHAVTLNSGGGFTVDFNVTTSDPLWFSSISNNDCQGGMVFAATSGTGTQTFEQFLNNARGGAPQSVTSAPTSASTSASTSAGAASSSVPAGQSSSVTRPGASASPSPSGSGTGAASAMGARSTGQVIAGAVVVAAAFMLGGVA